MLQHPSIYSFTKKAKNDVPPAEGTNAEDESQTKKKRARVEDPTTNEPAVVERPQGNKASTGAVASSAQGTPSNVPTAIDKILTMTASSSLNCRILHQAVFQDNSKGAGSAAAAAAKSAQEGQRCHVLTPDVCLGPGTAPISSNFLRGLKFSPDGLCILTNSEDTTLRVFDLFAAQPVETEAASHDASPSDGNQNASQTARKGAAPWDPVLEMHEGGMVYDFDWYPFMDSQHPATCAFISTSRGHTIHMWDAYTGDLRTSYRAYDHLDEITSAYSVKFTAGGDKILAGYNRCVRVFDVTRPGVPISTRATSKTKKSRQGQRGILSCIDSNPNRSGTYAVGSYAATVCVYEEDRGRPLHTFHAHRGGITQVKYSPDGLYLFAGARKDPHIHSWDLRFPRTPVRSFRRHADTNQQIGFDISADGTALLSGNSFGEVCFYNIHGSAEAGLSCVDSGKTALLPHLSLGGFGDAANSTAFHPLAPGTFAVGTGQRHFELDTAVEEWSADSDEDNSSASRVRAPHVVDIQLRSDMKKRNQLLVLSLSASSQRNRPL
eukprot:INCI17262.4.p1 GENE.INCI17262.4~~INCI17262.4.p1  ORF type:complete len:550 (+),score=72.05 INCI17262.4:358-2007(+)